MITQVGVVARAGNPEVADSLAVVLDTLRFAGVDSVLEKRTASLIGGAGGVSRERIGDDVELVVVVGGDGSILGVARDVVHRNVPVLGVNRGGLGFLAGISPPQIATKLPAVLRGEHTVEERFLLGAQIWRDGAAEGGVGAAEGGVGAIGGINAALNDVVVHAGSMSRMMDLRLFVDDEYVYDQRSDGLIVATPTGSTAYALSAGGPIMHPRLDAMVIVPMFPHTLTSRPLVVHGDSRVRVRVGSPDSDPPATPKVSCDSQLDRALRNGDEVRIGKHPHRLRLAFPVGHNFYESCRSKLDWATRLGGDF